MKALVYEEPGKVVVREVPVQQRAGEALVRVALAGICGTDMAIIGGKHPRAKAPLIPGHEFSGIIESVESNTAGFKAGDRVTAYPLISCGKCIACRTGNSHVCNTLRLLGIDRDGAMAEYASVPLDMLFRLPDELDYDIAALIEPVAVCVHAIRESALKYRDTVLITGAGPIGLLTGLLLRSSGASGIYISEIDDFRLSMCRRFGLEPIDLKSQEIIPFIKEKTGGDGVDVLFEASGSADAAAQMTELVRPRGQILMLAVHKEPRPVDLRQINFKEIDMLGSRVYTRQDYELALPYCAAMADELRQVITHRVPLADGPSAFSIFTSPKENSLKVFIDCRSTGESR